MKKILIYLLLTLSTTAHAHKIELVNKDGYMPLLIDPRIVFFVTKQYTDDTIAPKNTIGFFIVTVDCKLKLHRRTLTEVFNPITNTHHKLFKNNEEIATTMSAKEFSKIDPELVPITEKLCTTMIK
jgi:hypothetical protein